jgi:hypothetical protein
MEAEATVKPRLHRMMRTQMYCELDCELGPGSDRYGEYW